MSKSDDIESLTRELTSFLIKAKGEITRLKTEAKKDNEFKSLVRNKFKEMHDENQKLTKKLRDYEHYHKSHAIQKKRNARAARRLRNRQKKKEQLTELAILEEIKKLKKLDVESLLGTCSSKRKKKESESERESDSESEKEKRSTKKKKKSNKKSVLDLINS